MRNGERVLLAVLNLYVINKVRLVAFITNHSVSDITQSNQKLHDSAVKPLRRAGLRVNGSGQTIVLSISLRLEIYFLKYFGTTAPRGPRPTLLHF